MYRNNHPQVAAHMAKCLPEFMHINHYWDNQRDRVVAKILPGEFYMTTDVSVIATTIGSCIAACLWDSHAKIGGMNHFMLPTTDQPAHEINWGKRERVADATRYGNFAMEHLINTILKRGGRRVNLRAKVFGGGKILSQMSDIGQRNIDFVLGYLAQEDIFIESTDLGDIFPRKILFEPHTGRAFVKRLENLHNDTIVRRETDYRREIETKVLGGEVEIF